MTLVVLIGASGSGKTTSSNPPATFQGGDGSSSGRYRSSPGQLPFHEHGTDHLRIKRHATAALRGELVLGGEVANPTEGEQTPSCPKTGSGKT
jgi:hypothetical protein